ncbi:MAG: DUF4126 domain-containing protein [Leptospirales bacterium]|jgi:hypothetical protein
MDLLTAILLGVVLSAVCGMRVFVPPLFLSIAAQFGWMDVADNFAWLAGPEATLALGVATCMEVAAYYIPWLDNMLDTLATPLAIVAGTIVAASQFFDIPLIAEQSASVGWILAAIAGGGTAAIFQLLTVAVRTVSTGLTGGFGNFIVATFEAVAALFFTVLAIALPFVATTLLIALAVLLVALLQRNYLRFRKRRSAPPEDSRPDPPSVRPGPDDDTQRPPGLDPPSGGGGR